MQDDHMSVNDRASESDWIEQEDELPPRPRRRLLAPIPLALAAVLLIACGFIGGTLVEKGQTSSSQEGLSGALAARFAASGAGAAGGSSGAAGAGGSSGAAGAGGSSGGTGAGRSLFSARATGGSRAGQITTGQVTYVEGDTLYVEDAEGDTVKVKAPAGATVTKTSTTSVKSIHPGEPVLVTGTSSSNGAISARSISVGSAGGGLGGGLAGLLGAAGGRGSTGGGSSSSGSAQTGAGEPALFGK
jgi:hypothetical protein